MNTTTIRVAAACYPIDRLRRWRDYADKLARQVTAAAANGAQLLLFPEYAALELAALIPADESQDVQAQLAAVQAYRDPFLALHAALSREHGVYIAAASFPVRLAGGGFRNRVYLFAPTGRIDFQDKLYLTRCEQDWGIGGGEALNVFETACGPLGVCICYDVEFPWIARWLAMAGAKLILTPSCTEAWTGYHRVRYCSQARAVENQCYVVHAVTVGAAEWSPFIDRNVGRAAVYAPADFAFPDNGVLAETSGAGETWVYADLNGDLIDAVREQGQTLNFRDGAGPERQAVLTVVTL